MKKLKVKEILEMKSNELVNLMTEKQYERMRHMGIKNVWRLLELLQDGARTSGLDDNDDYVTIDEYLEYLKEMFSENED